MENLLWLILTFVILILSLIVSKKTNFKAYRIKSLLSSLKKDKTTLFLSLGTKVGVGSIIGTTISIIIGGPGALFWIWIFSLISFSLIYYESYIGNIYKKKTKDGFIGGPYFYIKSGLNKKRLANLSIILIIITYSLLFQMIQINTISNIVLINIDIKKFIMLIMFAVLLLVTLFSKSKELLSLLNKVVPFMCLFFVLIGIYVIIMNYSLVSEILITIFKEAFNRKSLIVGIIIGVKRSIFLNEIMIGTTSISAAADDLDKESASAIQTMGTYFITFVVCTITGLMILIFKEYNIISTTNFIELLNNVFIHHFGNIGGFILIILVVLFGVTTIISGYYIGSTYINYLVNKKSVLNIFRGFMLLFCLLGIYLSSDILWSTVDIFMYILILINIYSMFKFLKREDE